MQHLSRPTAVASWRLIFWSGVLLVGCARPAIVETAQGGDLVRLRQSIAAEQKAGTLDEKKTRAIARGMLEGDIQRSRGSEGADFVASLRSCAEPLEDALSNRAETRDATGGEAALVLVERNAWCGASPSSFASDEDGAWRALAAHEADGSGDAPQRRAFLIDRDERVRRAAADAALSAKSSADLSVLLEAGRVDPDPLTRSRALRAAGAIGGEGVALALRDRFDAGDEGDRLAILDAWAEEATWQAGGRAELLYASHHGSGPVALAAAVTFLRAGDGSKPTPELQSERAGAFARLARASVDGTASERRLALRLLPTEHPETEALLLTASKDADLEVALIATVRLAGRAAHQKAAETRLLEWARGEGSLRFEARAALSVYGSLDVLPLLTAEIGSKDARARLLAGTSLIRTGAVVDAAPLLADTDAGVRRSIACRLLSQLPPAR